MRNHASDSRQIYRSAADSDREDLKKKGQIMPPTFQLKSRGSDQSILISTIQSASKPSIQRDEEGNIEESPSKSKNENDRDISNAAEEGSADTSSIPNGINVVENSSKASQLKARAFTKGNNIHFAPNQYKPGTKEGDQLIGHELKHVEQQTERRVQPTTQMKSENVNDDSHLEQEADEAGVAYANGAWQPRSIAKLDGRVTQRKSQNGKKFQKRKNLQDYSPTVLVFITGIIFVIPDNVRFRKGSKSIQAVSAVLNSLVGKKHDKKLNSQLLRFMSNSGIIFKGFENDAYEGEKVFMIQSRSHLAWKIVKFLEDEKNLEIKLSKNQRQLIDDGVSADRSWITYSQTLGRGKGYKRIKRGDFYSEMNQRRGALRSVAKTNKSTKLSKHEKQKTTQSFLKNVAKEINFTKDLLAHLKAMRILFKHPMYQRLFGEPTDKSDTLETTHQQAQINFASFRYTEQKLAVEIMSNRAKTDGKKEKQLLNRFKEYEYESGRAKNGKNQALLKPSEYNARPLRAVIKSSPDVRVPKMTVVNAKISAYMSLSHQNAYDAMNYRYSYEWFQIPLHKFRKEEKKKRAPSRLETVKGIKSDKKKKSTTDMNLNNTYSGFQKTSDNWKTDSFKMFNDSSIGSLAAGLAFFSLAQINTILGYIGNIASFGKVISGPEVTQDFTIRKPGNYVLACVATPLTGDKRIKRPPSVALMPIQADHSKNIAFKGINELRRNRKKEKKAIKVYKRFIEKLQKLDVTSYSTSSNKNLKGQKKKGELKKFDKKTARYLQKSKNAQLEKYKDKKDALQAKHQSNFKYLKVLQNQIRRKIKKAKHPWEKSLLHVTLTQIEQRLVTYKSRVSNNVPGLKKAETIPTIFVGRDSGQTINLMIDAALEGKAQNGAYKYYISDITTNKAGFGSGQGVTKTEAIINGMKNLLQSANRYGRGSVCAEIDGRIVKFEIEQSAGAIALLSAQNLSTLLNLVGLATIPFSGGASMMLLGFSGAIGGATTGIKVYNRIEAATFRFDHEAIMDTIGFLGSTAGIGQTVLGGMNLIRKSYKLTKLANGAQMVGVGTDVATALMIKFELLASMVALQKEPIELRGKKAFAAISKAFLDVGMMAGAKIAHRLGAHFNKKTAGVKKLESNFKHGSADSPQNPFGYVRPDYGSPGYLFKKIAASKKTGIAMPKKNLNSNYSNNSIVSRNIFNPIWAYSIYQGAIDVSSGRKVGLFRNYKTREYFIVMGSENGIRLPREFKGSTQNVLIHTPKKKSQSSDNIGGQTPKTPSVDRSSQKSPNTSPFSNKSYAKSGKEQLAPLQVKPTDKALNARRDPNDPKNPEYLWERLGDPKYKYPVNNETHTKIRNYPDNSEFASKITDSRMAYKQYEKALAYSNGREVGIYYHLKSKMYRVVIGDKYLTVKGQPGEITVIHTHPINQSTKWAYFPSNQDFYGMMQQFARTGLKQRNIVESIIGDGTRVRTEFGIEPGITRGKFYVKYFDHESNAYLTRKFSSLNEMNTVRSKGSRYVEPGSLLHKIFMPNMEIRGYTFDKKNLTYTAKPILGKYMPKITYDKEKFRLTAKGENGNLALDRYFMTAGEIDYFIQNVFLSSMKPRTLSLPASSPYIPMTPKLPNGSSQSPRKKPNNNNSSMHSAPVNKMSDTNPNIKSPIPNGANQSRTPVTAGQNNQTQSQSSPFIPMKSGQKNTTASNPTTNPRIPIHNVQKIFFKTNRSNSPKSQSQKGQQNVNYNVKLFGDVPDNSVVHYSDTLWVIYSDSAGNHRIRFDARHSVIEGQATKTSNYSTDDSAGVTAQGLPFVFEGRHRAIGAAHGQDIGIDVGGVAGKKYILDYSYVGEKTPSKFIKAIDQAAPKIKPMSKKDADLKRQQYEDQLVKDIFSGKLKAVDPHQSLR